MNRSSTTPEFIVDQLGKRFQLWDHGKISHQNFKDRVAELQAVLLLQAGMSTRIESSLQELVQLLEEQE